MPIEDIDYLYDNSIKENIIIFVDSAKRDKDLYPKPSEFQIDFIEPFNYVYGIEILDTTIPRTMFMIEPTNNKLYTKYGYNMLSTQGMYLHEFRTQDFAAAAAFFQRINTQLDPVLIIDNNDNVFQDSNNSVRLFSDYPIVRFVSYEYPFYMDMKRSSMYNLLGFDQKALDTDHPKYVTLTKVLNTYVPIIMPNLNTDQIEQQVLVSKTSVFRYIHEPKYGVGTFLRSVEIHTENNMFIIGTIDIYDITADRNVYAKSITNTDTIEILDNHILLKHGHTYSFTITSNFESYKYLAVNYCYFINIRNIDEVHDKVFISKPLYDESGLVVLEYPSSSDAGFEVAYSETPYSFDLELSDAVESKLLESSIGTMTSFRIYVATHIEPITSEDIFILEISNNSTIVLELVLKYDDEDHIVMDISDTFDYAPFQYFKFDITEESVVSYSCKLFSSKNIKLGKTAQNTLAYSLTFQQISEFGIVSPGLLNLASENYIIMRCDEIENHLRGSYDMQQYSPGLGVLNIDVQGYASGRTEFYSVQYKEFHPLGKLSKMRFRFERKSDGKLYDFKNIDLHFLMSIKFLRPKQKEQFKQSVLNPNYDPNYLGYFGKTLDEFYDESTDDSDLDDEYINHEFGKREDLLTNQVKKYF